MNFLEFVKSRSAINENRQVINEAFKTKDVDNAHKLMLKLFKDKIGKNVIMDPSPIATKVNGKDAISVTFISLKDKKTIDVMWNLNYLVDGKSSAVYSVDFFNATQAEALLFGNGEATTALTIYTMGQSVAYFLPLIIHVAKNHDFSLGKKDAEDVAKTVFTNESRTWYYGALQCKVFESLKNDTIDTAFHLAQGHHLVDNGSEFVWESEADDIKKKVRQAEVESWKTKGDSEEARRRSLDLDKDYREICKAIKGGATTLNDLEVALGRKIKVAYNTDDSIGDTQKKVDEAEKKYRKDPEQAFKEMQGYVKTVIKGLQPGCVLCGAPGVGKTYRVMQQLKANGYVNGQNLAILKGKCTPRQMYLTLYEHKSKADMILIDDADSLIGPKAPEDVINILKAALDSTADDEGRLVSYRVSGELKDDEGVPVPKEHYFNGSIIVITNYSAGQIDTAVRNRCFVQSLDFSTEQLLKIIKGLLPAIDPARLSSQSKMKAYEYLEEMSAKGSDMEISIRSFSTCARLFQVCEGDPDFSDDDARSMIAEQMRLQSLRGGKKF